MVLLSMKTPLSWLICGACMLLSNQSLHQRIELSEEAGDVVLRRNPLIMWRTILLLKI
jgi:hypothetical protein